MSGYTLHIHYAVTDCIRRSQLNSVWPLGHDEQKKPLNSTPYRVVAGYCTHGGARDRITVVPSKLEVVGSKSVVLASFHYLPSSLLGACSLQVAFCLISGLADYPSLKRTASLQDTNTYYPMWKNSRVTLTEKPSYGFRLASSGANKQTFSA